MFAQKGCPPPESLKYEGNERAENDKGLNWHVRAMNWGGLIFTTF